MFNSSMKRFLLLFFCGVVGLLLVTHLQAPFAYAANAQVTITVPSPAMGHPGTKVHLDGSGFNPGQVNLFTTPNGDPAKCAPGDPDLKRFATSPSVTAQADGTFSLDTTWPDTAATVGNAYYVCAIGPGTGITGLSNNTFTVVPQVSINVSPTSVAQGGQVTVTGLNWLPPQSITVAVVPPTQATAIVSNHVTSDANGKFSITLTIPANTPAASYSVSAIADNEPTLKALSDNILTVTVAPTPTPTPTPPPTPTPTPSPTAVPTAVVPTPTSNTGGTTAPPAGNGTSSSGVSPSSFLLFTLAGLGILLVIVGIILFVMYSRGQ
ncbi:MAG TPA: hypothetical protein VFA10_29455 [Ktedonobacteraceae bacterium]|nr:hypothetical protein [Ktedonobacteraceae bacterium]